jgi:hypothetical protein
MPRADSGGFDRDPASHGIANETEAVPSSVPKSVEPAVDPTADLARCSLSRCSARAASCSASSLALVKQIRGILKTFGRIVSKGAGGLFEKNVRALIRDEAEIAAVIMPVKLLCLPESRFGKFAFMTRR